MLQWAWSLKVWTEIFSKPHLLDECCGTRCDVGGVRRAVHPDRAAGRLMRWRRGCRRSAGM